MDTHSAEDVGVGEAHGGVDEELEMVLQGDVLVVINLADEQQAHIDKHLERMGRVKHTVVLRKSKTRSDCGG